jgi:hypothetical protein
MDSIIFGIEIREFQPALHYLWACNVQCHIDVMMTLCPDLGAAFRRGAVLALCTLLVHNDLHDNFDKCKTCTTRRPS